MITKKDSDRITEILEFNGLIDDANHALLKVRDFMEKTSLPNNDIEQGNLENVPNYVKLTELIESLETRIANLELDVAQLMNANGPTPAPYAPPPIHIPPQPYQPWQPGEPIPDTILPPYYKIYPSGIGTSDNKIKIESNGINQDPTLRDFDIDERGWMTFKDQDDIPLDANSSLHFTSIDEDQQVNPDYTPFDADNPIDFTSFNEFQKKPPVDI